MSEETRSTAFRVTGRVQGVSFRAWTQAEARQSRLSGWVRNRSDGTVEGVVAGPDEAVRGFLERLRVGPRAAEVTDVSVEPAEERPEGAFEIRG